MSAVQVWEDALRERVEVPSLKHPSGGRPGSPLEGVRVADFSWYAAGPFCTLMLGMLGAEVIRVESSLKRDSHRKPHPVYGRHYVAPYDQLLSNKRSLSVNLKTKEGIEVAKDLVRESDVVVQNFSPGVMERLGLDFETLLALQPMLVMLSLSAAGQTGPSRFDRGFAPHFAALAGLSAAAGFPDGPPLELRNPMDHVCGLTGAYAVLGALHHLEKRGRGIHLDLSNREVGMSLVGHVFQDLPDAERNWTRTGNARPLRVPCGVYPADGDDQWIAIDVGSDLHWDGLVRCLHIEQAVINLDLSGLDRRLAHRELIDSLVANWTRVRSAHDAAETLQAHGVPADKVARADDLVSDPHLALRGSIFTMTREQEGGIVKRTAVGAPWKFSLSDVGNDVWSPELGEDTKYILERILGYSGDQVSALEGAGILT